MSAALNSLTLRTSEEVAENLHSILDAINTACLNLIEAAEIEPEDSLIALKRATVTRNTYDQLARQSQGMIFKLNRLERNLAGSLEIPDINDQFLNSFPEDADDLLKEIGDILTFNSVEKGAPLSPTAILSKLQAENDGTEDLKEADIIAKLEELKTVLATIGMELVEQDGGYVILAAAKSETEDDDEPEAETATIKETAQIFRTTIETATSALELLFNAEDQEKRKALSKIEKADPVSIMEKIKDAIENCADAHKIVQTGQDHHVPPAYFEAQKPASMTPMREKIAQAIINAPSPIGIAEICKQIRAREDQIYGEMQHLASELACMGLHLMAKNVGTWRNKYKIYYAVWMSPDEEIPEARRRNKPQKKSGPRRGRTPQLIPKQEIPEGKPKFVDFFTEYEFVFQDRTARLIAKVLMEEADGDQQPMSVETIHAAINNPEISLRDVGLAMRIVRSACAKIGINLENIIRRTKAAEKKAITYRTLWNLDFNDTLPIRPELEPEPEPEAETACDTVEAELSVSQPQPEVANDGPPILSVQEQITWVVTMLGRFETSDLQEDPVPEKELRNWAATGFDCDGTETLHRLTILADPEHIAAIVAQVPGLKVTGKNGDLKFSA